MSVISSVEVRSTVVSRLKATPVNVSMHNKMKVRIVHSGKRGEAKAYAGSIP